MGQQVDIDDLLGAAEIAAVLGLSHRQSVTTYLRRYPEFPRPIVEKSGGRVRLWLRSDIEDWANSNDRSSHEG